MDAIVQHHDGRKILVKKYFSNDLYKALRLTISDILIPQIHIDCNTWQTKLSVNIIYCLLVKLFSQLFVKSTI